MFRSALLLCVVACLLENSVLGRPSDDVTNDPAQSSALSKQEIGPSDEELKESQKTEMQHHSNGEGLPSFNAEMYDEAPLSIREQINEANYMIGHHENKQRVRRSTRVKRGQADCDRYCRRMGRVGYCEVVDSRYYSGLCGGYGRNCNCNW